MKQERTVLVTSRSFGSGNADPVGLLEDCGLEVVRGDPEHDLERLASVLRRSVGWIAGVGPVTEAHLDAAPHLKIVARYGTGTEAVDVAAAAARGVRVTNTPGANAVAVAEHTIGLLLAALRGTVTGDREVRAGGWPSVRGRELGALTVGLVGFGQVGQHVAHLLACLDSNLLVHDPVLDHEACNRVGARACDVDALLAGSDIVSLHRPAGTEPLVDRTFLARMRQVQCW